jgi:hypothetical protein
MRVGHVTFGAWDYDGIKTAYCKLIGKVLKVYAGAWYVRKLLARCCIELVLKGLQLLKKRRCVDAFSTVSRSPVSDMNFSVFRFMRGSSYRNVS